MKLLEFHIGKYRVLRDLDIYFDRPKGTGPDPQQGYALDFLVGVNGTGKSTVLHLLGRVFAQLLTENYDFPVPITLKYQLQGDEIAVSNNPETEEDTQENSNGVLRYRLNGGDWVTGKLPSNLLPRQIVIYTTGNESNWLDELFQTNGVETNETYVVVEEDEASAYLHELPGHKRPSLDDESQNTDFDSPLLFIQSKRLSLVTLCGLLASRKTKSGTSEILENVLKSISLLGLNAFSLRIRSQRSLTLLAQQEVIADLNRVADHTVQQGSDTLMVFNIDEQLKKDISIFNLYESLMALFQRLNYLYEHRPYYDPPLQEVSLFMKSRPKSSDDAARADVDEPMLQLYDWLSDGEQSFLARMALFALFRADDMLIMLDEPEVHFNDVWKREIVNMLDKIMTGMQSHALITTHSSIALTDVRKEDILVLHRQDQLNEGELAITVPSINTLGADPSDILVHVFGASSATGQRSVDFIREAIGRSNSVDELQRLEKMVAPGYWRYRIQLEAHRLTS